jgi:hypothetical protein
MINLLLVLALVAFLLWLFFHVVGALVHLLWLVIVVAVAVWAAHHLLRRLRAS